MTLRASRYRADLRAPAFRPDYDIPVAPISTGLRAALAHALTDGPRRQRIRPSFGALKKTRPPLAVIPTAEDTPTATKSKSVPSIQTSVRLELAMSAALNDQATRKRVEDGWRVTEHYLLIADGRYILAVNGVKLSKWQSTMQPCC